MVTTTAPDLGQKLLYLRSHGMTTLTLDRHQGRAASYDVVVPGLNYRIDEMRAALGLVQLAKLPAAQERRANLVARYVAALRDLEGLTIPFLDPGDVQSAYHIFTVLLPPARDRGRVIESLKTDGIQSSIHYPAFQEFSAYRATDLCDTPVAREISHRELTLPLYPTMSDDEVEMVISSFRRAL